MDFIDVGIVAIVRPEILRKTLESFYNRVIAPNWEFRFRAIVNVDPLGPDNSYPSAKEMEAIVGIVEEFMPVRSAHIPVSEKAHHMALGRVWSRVTTEYMVHLEDDWIFHKPVSLGPCIDFLEQLPTASGVVFDRADRSVLDGKVETIAGGADRVVVRRCDLHGPPAILRRHYAKNLGALFLFTKRKGLPKKIIKRDKVIQDFLTRYPLAGVYMGEDKKGRVVSDSGREWRFKHNMEKKGRKWKKKSA
jgi:hypothetical protein